MSELPTVLIVDDEVRSLESLVRVLDEDFEVLTASDTAEAEAILGRRRFREDLFYRLATVILHLPPLRERTGDIPILAEALLEEAMKGLGKPVLGFTREALERMQAYHWPGNVRELQNEICHMLVMADGNWLGAELLTRRVLYAVPEAAWDVTKLLAGQTGPLKERVEMLEARILKETLIRHRWNKSRAARELGLSRVGLRSKLERYGLELAGKPRPERETIDV